MLKSERLYLKPIDESDIEWLRETRNKYKDHFFDAGEISKEQQKQWYSRYREIEGKDQMFIIQLKNGTNIGTVAVYNIDVSTRTADFGRFLLIDEYRHHGYAEEAVQCLMDYCWNTLRLWKIKLSVFLDNIDALAIYARSGFKTTSRPIILLENVNEKVDFKKPIKIEDV
jgi:RimJ/RimL family protein N-acetyltransferase